MKLITIIEVYSIPGVLLTCVLCFLVFVVVDGGTRVRVMFIIFCTRQRDLLAGNWLFDMDGNMNSTNTKITSPRKNTTVQTIYAPDPIASVLATIPE